MIEMFLESLEEVSALIDKRTAIVAGERCS
jgi:hypothetical protein